MQTKIPQWNGTLDFDEPVRTEVVDVPVDQIRNGSKPSKKGNTAKSATPVPAQFAIAHSSTLDMYTVSFTLASAILQGIASSKLDAQGVPATQAFWIAIAIIIPGLFLMASKTGNQKLWVMGIKLAIAIAISPGLTQGLHFVFGGNQ